jgi:hypothetical protein
MLNVPQRPPVLSPLISPITEQKDFIPKEVEPVVVTSSPIVVSAVAPIDEVNEVVNEKMLDPFAELSTGPSLPKDEVKIKSYKL